MNGDPLMMPLTQMVARFGNLENWKEAYEARGYIVIDLTYVTWFYVAQVISGQKLLIRQAQLANFVMVPPRCTHQTYRE